VSSFLFNSTIGLLIVAAIVLVIAAVYAVGGAIFAFFWNLLMPGLWTALFHTACPHMTWMMGIAAAWVIGILQGIFGGFRGVIKKEG